MASIRRNTKWRAMKTITDPKTGTTSTVLTDSDRAKFANFADTLARFEWLETNGGRLPAPEGSNARLADVAADSIRKILEATKPTDPEAPAEPSGEETAER